MDNDEIFSKVRSIISEQLDKKKMKLPQTLDLLKILMQIV